MDLPFLEQKAPIDSADMQIQALRGVRCDGTRFLFHVAQAGWIEDIIDKDVQAVAIGPKV